MINYHRVTKDNYIQHLVLMLFSVKQQAYGLNRNTQSRVLSLFVTAVIIYIIVCNLKEGPCKEKNSICDHVVGFISYLY